MHLSRASSEPRVTQYVLRDIHRENLFFEGGNPSGLFDFDAARVDTPWTDLSRWIGSFVRGQPEDSLLWDEAVELFVGHDSGVSESEAEWGRCFVENLHEVSTWISLGNWLVWLIAEGRDFEVSSQVTADRIDRLTHLVSCMD